MRGIYPTLETIGMWGIQTVLELRDDVEGLRTDQENRGVL